MPVFLYLRRLSLHRTDFCNFHVQCTYLLVCLCNFCLLLLNLLALVRQVLLGPGQLLSERREGVRVSLVLGGGGLELGDLRVTLLEGLLVLLGEPVSVLREGLRLGGALPGLLELALQRGDLGLQLAGALSVLAGLGQLLLEPLGLLLSLGEGGLRLAQLALELLVLLGLLVLLRDGLVHLLALVRQVLLGPGQLLSERRGYVRVALALGQLLLQCNTLLLKHLDHVLRIIALISLHLIL